MISHTSGAAIYEKPCSPLSAAAAGDVSNHMTGRCLCSAELGRGGAVQPFWLCRSGDPSPGWGAKDKSLNHGSHFSLFLAVKWS